MQLTCRAELAKSLAAYAKNHFPSGSSSVTCSQHPLLPPAPPATLSPPAPTTSQPAEEILEKVEEPVVSDIVPEQVAAGDNEPAPTPAVGDSPKEEVDQPGGLEKLDEKVEEVKEEEAGVIPVEGAEVEDSKATPAEPIVEEEAAKEQTTLEEPSLDEKPVVEEETKSVAAVEERKQERIENPVYTLEVVGNKYNTSNFWSVALVSFVAALADNQDRKMEDEVDCRPGCGCCQWEDSRRCALL